MAPGTTAIFEDSMLPLIPRVAVSLLCFCRTSTLTGFLQAPYQSLVSLVRGNRVTCVALCVPRAFQRGFDLLIHRRQHRFYQIFGILAYRLSRLIFVVMISKILSHVGLYLPFEIIETLKSHLSSQRLVCYGRSAEYPLR